MSNIGRYAGFGRGPSAELWHGVDFERLALKDGGFLFFDNFMGLSTLTGRYTVTQATAGTFVLGDLKGRQAIADSGATTDGQGVQVQLATTVGEAFQGDADDTIIFEARLSLHALGTALASSPDFFVGLAEIDTTIIASSAMTTGSYVGLESVSTDGIIIGVNRDGTTRKTVAALHTMVDSDVTANSYVKLGFRIDGTSKITFFVNGVPNGTTTTANIPTALMTPSLVCQSAGTTQPKARLDWWGCAVIETAVP